MCPLINSIKSGPISSRSLDRPRYPLWLSSIWMIPFLMIISSLCICMFILLSNKFSLTIILEKIRPDNSGRISITPSPYISARTFSLNTSVKNSLLFDTAYARLSPAKLFFSAVCPFQQRRIRIRLDGHTHSVEFADYFVIDDAL